MTNKFLPNFVPTSDLFGSTSDLTEFLTYFYLSKTGLGFQFDTQIILKNPGKLLACLYCVLPLLLFPRSAVAQSSPILIPVPIGQTNFDVKARQRNSFTELSSLPISKISITQPSPQQENYKLLIGGGIVFEYKDEQVYQHPGVGQNFLELVSEIQQNGLQLDAARRNQLKGHTQILKKSFTTICRRLLTGHVPHPTHYYLPADNHDILPGFSGLCERDQNGQFIGMVHTDALSNLLNGDFVKAANISKQIKTIQQIERFLNQLEVGVSLDRLTGCLDEIATFLRNLETIDNRPSEAKRKATINCSVKNIQIYTSPIPFLGANVSAQINFADQNVFVGMGKAFFCPLYNTRLWEMKFGGILGFDCSCGYNFSKNHYAGLQAKTFVGLGVKL